MTVAIAKEEEPALFFNVEEDFDNGSDYGYGWETYRSFIHSIRIKYFPIVLQNHHDTSGQFDVILATYSHHLKLRLDLRTFKLRGYQMEMGQWHEYGYHHSLRKRPLVQYIPGSSFLEMTQDNISSESDMGVGTTMDNLRLGQRQLTTAINLLATSFDRQLKAYSLLIVSLMICEPIKFDCVLNYIATTFLVSRSLPLQMLWLIRVYEGESDFVFRLHEVTLSTEKSSISHLYNIDEHCNNSNSSLVDAPKPTWYHYYHPDDDTDGCMMVRTLVEVLSVRINKINGEASGDFYGSITITSGLYTKLLYHREKEESEFICSGDNLLLIVPTSICLCTSDSFEFNFVIMDKRIPKSDGEICWYSNRGSYDLPLVGDFDTDYCSLTTNYIVFRDAVQATVEVTILDIVGVARLYGEISARSSKFEDYETVLFRNTKEEHIDVFPGKLLKLSKSIVVVPWESSFIIQAKLYDYGEDFSFAEGIAEFPAQLGCSADKNISGTRSGIRVRITWS